MASRLTTRTKPLVPALPLVVGLAIGTLLATATLSWGNAFIIWQLLLWSIVSIVIGLVTARVAPMMPLPTPASSSDEDIRRLSVLVGLSYAGAALALLAGLAIAISVTVTDGVATVPVELYWPLPIAAFFFAIPGPAQSRLGEMQDEQRRAYIASQQAYYESQRKKRCSEASPERRAEYDVKFLWALYSLVRGDRTKLFSLSQITEKLGDECTPELQSAALQMWQERKFITDKTYVPEIDMYFPNYGLTLAGYYTCVRADKFGMEEALRRHDSCLRLDDEYKAAYQRQLFSDIARFALPAKEQTISLGSWETLPPRRLRGPERGSKPVFMSILQSAQKDPCWPEFFDAALEALRELGLIVVIKNQKPPPRPSGLGFFGVSQPDNKPDPEPKVELTAKGQVVYADLHPRDSVERAVNRYEEQQRLEHERQQRCREITGAQRKEFEEEFLLQLYGESLGDVRPVMLHNVWSRLDHECTRELTGHALQIWRELNCIKIESMYLRNNGEGEADVQIFIDEHMHLALTALGRELCMRAQPPGSMSQARKDLLEVSHVTEHNYIRGDVFTNISDATIINRSNLEHVVVSTKDSVGPDVGEALRQLAEFIEQSGNSEAAENFNAFTEELQQPKPRKALLKSFWNGMLAALPTIAELATVAGTIAALIA
jgi:hypothetical protein